MKGWDLISQNPSTNPTYINKVGDLWSLLFTNQNNKNERREINPRVLGGGDLVMERKANLKYLIS
ncbi:hypothetical protein Syun_009459 [Stephania yunnanensis]|uniref:Uncharacterized protein n=1 Tax=Stephania yunnanensis TaxID=152371 RepID=A0AAP0PQW3_9MAGN